MLERFRQKAESKYAALRVPPGRLFRSNFFSCRPEMRQGMNSARVDKVCVGK